MNTSQVSSVIMGATKVSQLEDNLGALDIEAKMTDVHMQRIEQILNNKPVLAREKSMSVFFGDEGVAYMKQV